MPLSSRSSSCSSIRSSGNTIGEPVRGISSSRRPSVFSSRSPMNTIRHSYPAEVALGVMWPSTALGWVWRYRLSGCEAVVFRLEKYWHALHFLLTGDDSLDPPGPVPPPRGNVVLGGAATPLETGYGPVRYLNPQEVREVADVLCAIPVEELQRRFNAENFNDRRIYSYARRPRIWSRCWRRCIRSWSSSSAGQPRLATLSWSPSSERGVAELVATACSLLASVVRRNMTPSCPRCSTWQRPCSRSIRSQPHSSSHSLAASPSSRAASDSSLFPPFASVQSRFCPEQAESK